MKTSVRSKNAKKTIHNGEKMPFDDIVSAMIKVRGVTQVKMFGTVGLKFKGKVFAMVVKGKLVVKLSKERVEKMVNAGNGEYFDPGHGRLMKEWVAVEATRSNSWLGLAKEAREYIGSLR
ncbi:MAG: TfoX/Sxy family protein [Ignavibacteriales bacterium]|nr:TfoX/Sxy family protein [Ignavibacteriales bacterium]